MTEDDFFSSANLASMRLALIALGECQFTDSSRAARKRRLIFEIRQLMDELEKEIGVIHFPRYYRAD